MSENEQKRNGPYIEWWDMGTKKLETTYVDGKRHGLYQEWHENGVKLVEMTYVNEVEYGLAQKWTSGGTKIFECTYVNGKKEGLCTIRPNNDYDDDISDLKIYEYKNDVIIRTISMRDKNGRECVLQPGDITVWKACRVGIVDPRHKINDQLCGALLLVGWFSIIYGAYFSYELSHTIIGMIICVIIGATTGGIVSPVTSFKGVYVRLIVPKEARRITPLDHDKSFKSRVEYAKVEQIVDSDGKKYKEAFSCVNVNNPLIYKVGTMIYPNKFDDNIMIECGAGINVHAYKDQCEKWFTFGIS
jgi:hypothetical protein